MPELPYGIIANRMRDGQVVPFLGAGASYIGRAPGTAWNPEEPAFLPSGVELAHLLAGEAGFPSDDPRDRDDLAKVSSFYVDQGGRRALRERLRKLFAAEYTPGPLHALLARVESPQVIVVTNYDTLVEQAFRAAGKPYDLVVYPADRKDFANATLWWRHGDNTPTVKAPNELDIDLGKTTVIFKMHGTVVRGTVDEWDSFVITEEDYVEFLSRMTTSAAIPSLLYPHFRQRSFLFLGYSLRDWNLRVVLKNLSKYLSRRGGAGGDDEVPPSWSIQLDPTELDRRLWEKRGVRIYDLGLDDFVAALGAALER
jgi:hypothetical protein